MRRVLKYWLRSELTGKFPGLFCNCFSRDFAVVILLFVCLHALPVTRTSTGSGNWGNSATWSPSGVPACGDSVVILATHIVTISSQQNYNSCSTRLSVAIQGTLY